MSRKQFDRMELLTDETEVDRTFLHSKLHAIVHVPLSLSLSLSRTSFLSLLSFIPFDVLQLQSPNPTDRVSGVQVTSTYFCKNLGMSLARARQLGNSKKSASGMRAALFQAQIISDLSRFNRRSRIWATSFHLPLRRSNGILSLFLLLILSLASLINEGTLGGVGFSSSRVQGCKGAAALTVPQVPVARPLYLVLREGLSRSQIKI